MGDMSSPPRSPNPTPIPEPNRGPDRFGKFGMAVVGFAAAVLSFQTWVLLAQAVGFDSHWTVRIPLGIDGRGIGFAVWIAWLYPIAVDWYSVVVTRVWLTARRGSRVGRFARANSIGAIALAFVAQAVFHALTALGFTVGHAWWFVVIVGGMPPVLAGLVVHLYHELTNERHDQQAAALAEATRIAELAERTVLAEAERIARAGANRIDPGPRSGISDPDPGSIPGADPGSNPIPNSTRRVTKPKPIPDAEPGGNVVPIRNRSDRTEEALADEVRAVVRDHWRRTRKVIGRAELRAAVRCRYDRTRELIDRAVAELRELGDIDDEPREAAMA